MEADNKTYVVATGHSWNLEKFASYSQELPGNWILVSSKNSLTVELVEPLRPRYIFFPHWSYKVPKNIWQKYECVCFHMTDVPYGRGGSPLQNLIASGHSETMVSALRMEEELDAGPVYMKRPLGLEGCAIDIFKRCADIVSQMIGEIVLSEPVPIPQTGAVTKFKRRASDQSRMPQRATARKIYDHIRMLDADGYPKAFINHGQFRLRFSEASLEENGVRASVMISSAEEDEK